MIRLALCGLATMLDDIVSTLIDDLPDVKIVARLAWTGDLRGDFDRAGADLLVCALDAGEIEAAWRSELSRTPPLAVLNLEDDSRRGHLYILRHHEHVVAPMTAAKLRGLLKAESQAGRVAGAPPG